MKTIHKNGSTIEYANTSDKVEGQVNSFLLYVEEATPISKKTWKYIKTKKEKANASNNEKI